MTDEPLHLTLRLKSGPDDSIAWHNVWRDYSDLADLEVTRLSASYLDGRTRVGASPDFPFERLLELVGQIDERTQNLLDGQNVILDRIYEMEKAARLLLEAYDRSSAEIKDSCLATLRAVLGNLWDVLADPSRKFLLAAEYWYTRTPADLEFSGVIVSLMKAFEFELKRQLQPFREEIERVTRSHAEMPQKPIARFTLGDFIRVLRDGKVDIQPIFSRHGLDSERILGAATLVNSEAGAKHLEEKGKIDATTLRGLFLGRDSVLRCLFSLDT